MACVVILPNTDVDLAEATVALILQNMDCEASAQPGDLVRIDTLIPNKVVVAVDNSVKEPVIGVIKVKNTSTTCDVYLRGIIDRVLPQGRLYLSALGDFTNTPPTADYLQTLGYSFGNGKINLEPNQIVTKIN
jgi:hypothetical protein